MNISKGVVVVRNVNSTSEMGPRSLVVSHWKGARALRPVGPDPNFGPGPIFGPGPRARGLLIYHLLLNIVFSPIESYEILFHHVSERFFLPARAPPSQIQ